MAVVRTVLGDIEPGLLGFTHAHEHLFVFPTRGVDLESKLIIDDYEKSCRELAAFRTAGGGAVADVQPFGAGRNAELLARASGETGVRVVAATGLHRSLFYPKDFWMYRADVEELASLFASEIQEGMYAYHPADPFARRTGVRAGIIKIGTDAEGLTPHYRKVFEAAARAHRATGAPVMTHTELSTRGREQAEFLMEHGVAPGSIIISHMDRVAELERSLEVARLGVYLEYDTIARYRYHSDEEELDLILGMIRAGFAERLLLGMDVTRQRLLAYGGSFGLTHLAGSFLPRLREAGATEGEIQAMMVDNPARALALAEPRGRRSAGGGERGRERGREP